MLDALRAYYQKQGISAVGFKCPFQAECRAQCSKEFVTAREAYVGREYEKGTLPRVLFVSLDPESDNPGRHPSQRTLEAMRTWEEHEWVDPARTLRSGSHWLATHKFAEDVLRPFAEAQGVSIRQQNVHRYFAHTNSAKCKDVLRGSRTGDEVLFKNCAEFLPGEIAALEPDVIVAQGQFARAAVGSAFQSVRRMEHPTDAQFEVQVVCLCGRSALRICMNHPSGRNAHWHHESRVAYDWYVRTAAEFLRESRAGMLRLKPRLKR